MKKILFSALAIIGCASYSSGQTIPPYVPTSGLVSWWPFTGNAIDSSGNGNHGSVISAKLTSDRFGKANSAYFYDYTKWSWGSGGDQIYVPYNSKFNTTNISVSAWAYRNSAGYSGQGMTIINRFQYGYSSPNGQTWSMGTPPTFEIGTGVLGAWGSSLSSPQPSIGISGPKLDLLQWKHVVFTFDGIFLKQFCDGIIVDSVASSGLKINTAGNSGLSIGVSDQANGHWSPFDGKIDDIGIWNRALSACEISKLYLASNTFFTSKPANQAVKIGASASFTIKDTLGTSATYQWQENSGAGFVNLSNTSPYSGVNTKTLDINPVVAGMHNNQYRCIRNSGTSCLDTSAAAILTLSNLSIKANQVEGLTIRPNPVHNSLSISAPATINKLVLYNTLGQLIFESNPRTKTASIDMSVYPAGMYILKLNDEWVEKIIKE
jgi:hypothetical protein